jgi:hypothetical protein
VKLQGMKERGEIGNHHGHANPGHAVGELTRGRRATLLVPSPLPYAPTRVHICELCTQLPLALYAIKDTRTHSQCLPSFPYDTLSKQSRSTLAATHTLTYALLSSLNSLFQRTRSLRPSQPRLRSLLPNSRAAIR